MRLKTFVKLEIAATIALSLIVTVLLGICVGYMGRVVYLAADKCISTELSAREYDYVR